MLRFRSRTGANNLPDGGQISQLIYFRSGDKDICIYFYFLSYCPASQYSCSLSTRTTRFNLFFFPSFFPRLVETNYFVCCAAGKKCNLCLKGYTHANALRYTYARMSVLKLQDVASRDFFFPFLPRTRYVFTLAERFAFSAARRLILREKIYSRNAQNTRECARQVCMRCREVASAPGPLRDERRVPSRRRALLIKITFK